MQLHAILEQYLVQEMHNTIAFNTPNIEQWLICLNQAKALVTYNSVSDSSINAALKPNKDLDDAKGAWIDHKTENIYKQLKACEEAILGIEDSIRYRMLYEYTHQLLIKYAQHNTLNDKSIDDVHVYLKMKAKIDMLIDGLRHPSFQNMVPPGLYITQELMDMPKWLSLYVEMYPKWEETHASKKNSLETGVDYACR